jgi:hypothetical protein
MNRWCLIGLLLLLSLSGCIVDMDYRAAGTSTANIAVIGEFLYAILVLLCFCLFRLATMCGALLISYALILSANNVQLFQNSPLWLILLGFVLICLGILQPKKLYKPMIHFHKTPIKVEEKLEKHSIFTQLLIQIVSGCISGVLLGLIQSYFK